MTSRGAQLAAAIAGQRRPCALVDLDAFDRNLDRLCAPLAGRDLTLRVASKSLRVPQLMRRVLERPEARGVLCFHVEEARLLAEQGFDDLLVAYPPAPEDAPVYAALSAEGTRIWAVVDGVDAVRSLGRAACEAGTEVALCLDIDLSLRVGGVHIGVRRSPLRSAEDALALAARIADTPGVRLTAVLGYEAQVAGVQDHTGGVTDLAMKWVKRRSRGLAVERRGAVVDALRDAGFDIEVVNGGGTGSVDFTAADPSCTEVSAGSGLFCPHLFDGYAGLDLEPAAFFALSVVRSSDTGFATCFGGGWVASGSAGPDRLPRPWWPEGLSGVGLEGFGEVQTPFASNDLHYGSTVLCRHAKAGELAEHFAEVILVSGGAVVDVVPTYRGLGTRFG
jgi:D-serine deaminase-like pyridoxal phosphate-dependent protein